MGCGASKQAGSAGAPEESVHGQHKVTLPSDVVGVEVPGALPHALSEKEKEAHRMSAHVHFADWAEIYEGGGAGEDEEWWTDEDEMKAEMEYVEEINRQGGKHRVGGEEAMIIAAHLHKEVEEDEAVLHLGEKQKQQAGQGQGEGVGHWSPGVAAAVEVC